MILLNCEQGTPEWHEARLGVITASCADKLITPTGKPSVQHTGYAAELVGEQLIGRPDESFQSDWMARGHEQEPDARRLYEFHKDVDVAQVGFAYRDESKRVGCSPDGLPDKGGVEIKCPKLSNHVLYLYGNAIPNKYVPQVQMQMWVTDREWWDFMSYYPGATPLIVRVERDDKFIAALAKQVDVTLEKMESMATRIGEIYA
jgi:hypothetical protein